METSQITSFPPCTNRQRRCDAIAHDLEQNTWGSLATDMPSQPCDICKRTLLKTVFQMSDPMCHNIILLECDSKGDTIIKTYYPTESPLCAEAQAAGGTSHCNTRIAEACDLLAARGSIKLG
ncbi:hypothetical protein BST61_g6817 [Cercospora zeina]